MTNTRGLITVKKWLAKRGLLLRALREPTLPITEFATALRDLIDPRHRCSPPFTSHTDGAAYIRQVAGWIKNSKAADNLPDWKEERAIQDRKNNYSLLKKQRRAKRARQRLKEQRERSHADGWTDYRNRLASEWLIVKR
jgi:hypothetical protein